MGKLLMIDDDPVVLLVAARALEDAGYEVKTAESGPAGLAIAGEPGMKFDCVLVDQDMEGLTGLEVVRRLRILEGYQEVPISIVSSRPLGWLRHQPAQVGARWMRKHPDPQVLVRHVAGLLAGS